MRLILQTDDAIGLSFNKALDTPDQSQTTTSETPTKPTKQKFKQNKKQSTRIDLLHCDLIKDEFWDNRPWLLSD
jgi:tRNA(His) guanylyltransferase